MAESTNSDEQNGEAFPRACEHVTLTKVEQSGINEVDTDVSLYTCAACGKSFTITDL